MLNMKLLKNGLNNLKNKIMENIFICLLTGFLLCGVIIGIIFKKK